MDQLARQYKGCALLFLGIAITVQFFMVKVFPNYYKIVPNEAIGFLLSNTFLYYWVAWFPLFLFDKVGWKYVNPKINLADKWHYNVTYYPTEVQHLSKRGQKNLMDLLQHVKNNHGQVLVNQSPFEICFQDGTGTLESETGATKTTWEGISVSVSKNGKVMIHFQSNLGGIKFEGIDDLTVKERSKRGLPIEMHGHFRMFPERADVVLKGEITYRRIDKKQN